MNEIILKFYEAHVITSGRLEGVLNGLQYNLAWEVREVISEIMERLLFKRFHCETILERLSNELQDATFDDPYHVSFGSTILLKDLPVKFETYKQRVRGKIKCYVFY